jgi:hypothetical protein
MSTCKSTTSIEKVGSLNTFSPSNSPIRLPLTYPEASAPDASHEQPVETWTFVSLKREKKTITCPSPMQIHKG